MSATAAWGSADESAASAAPRALEDPPAAPAAPRRHNTLHHVVDRHDPLDTVVLVDNGHSQQVVLCGDLGDLARARIDSNRDDILDHEVADLGLGLGHDQIAKRENTEEVFLLVDHIDVVHTLGIRFELAQPLDRLGRGQGMEDRDVFRRHEATGRVLAVRQQLFNVLGLVFLHFLQQLLGPLAWHIGQQVGDLVWRHRLQDVRGTFDVEPFQDGGLHMRFVDLLEGIGGLFVAQGGEDRAPVIRAEFVDDVGDVGRMHLGQLGMGDPELDGTHVAPHRIDGLPGDEFLWPVQAEGCGDPPPKPFDSNPSGKTAAAHVHPDQKQRPLDLGQLEVVDTHYPAAVHVDDLLVEDLSRKPELVVDSCVRLQAGLVDLEAQLLVVPAAHDRPVDGAHPAIPLQDHARNARKRLSHDDHQVADSSNTMLSNIDDLSVDESTEEDQYASSGIA